MKKNKLFKKSNIIIFLVLIVIFIWGNIYIYNKLIQAKSVYNPYIFLLIININVVFFLTILAVILRNLIKLFFESKEKGSLRKKLSLILISLIILPAMILSTASISLISNATNIWFSGKVENALGSLEKLAEDSIKSSKVFIDSVVNLLEEGKVKPEELIGKFNIEYIEILDKNKNLIKNYGKLDLKTPYVEYQRKFKDGYIVIYYKIPKNIYQDYTTISEIKSIYSKFRYYKNPIRISYIITMLVITIFVILSAIWFSRYIVRNLTTPLEKLVNASQKLASGNLNVKINTDAPDEIGILIEEFNKMVEELKKLYFKLERSNKELKANKEYLETILENARTGVIYSNRFGMIEKINKAASQILNIDIKDLAQKPIVDLFKQIGINLNKLDKEQTLKINDKIIVAKLSQISPKGYILVFDDITDIVAAEKVLTWKEIARRIAHEIKNPLTPIKLSAERIKRQFDNNNPKFEEILNKSVNIIKTEVDYLSKLVKEFSQLAKTDKPINREEINLFNFLNNMSQSYNSSKFKIELDIPKDIVIKGDKDLLKQAFLNLIQNSYESIEELNKKGVLKIKAEKLKDKIRIEFKDNGKGISPDKINKIFLPYYTEKPKGSGLGLTIVKEIIEKHNGKIYAKPSKEGAIFVIEFPES
jgi:two-component system nitrogen regulation sensor histidine kinase NtrY